MRRLGLIGRPLEHSFSERYFGEKFLKEQIGGYSYTNFPLGEISELPELVDRYPDLIGLNVTIPYKQEVIEYLDELDPLAETVGAVNTIAMSRASGRTKLRGYNTDVYGFHHSLEPLMRGQEGRALVLGTGGASRAVTRALGIMGTDFTMVSRKPSGGMLSYTDLCAAVLRKYNLIINTTPLGTYPEVDEFPDIPYDLLNENYLLYDLVYNPPETKFLRLGRQKGARIQNGQRMLELQAEKSWEIWTHEPGSVKMI